MIIIMSTSESGIIVAITLSITGTISLCQLLALFH